jgi:hypothetical protein
MIKWKRLLPLNKNLAAIGAWFLAAIRGGGEEKFEKKTILWCEIYFCFICSLTWKLLEHLLEQ